ncbi:hypothetical protein [Sporosarcina sp. SAFN-015]|uniref:hypothetical protein n=1 Tax=Sporosarcina sp. SAFN-015 TaxID=3387274 RepID=UPI003F7EF7CF
MFTDKQIPDRGMSVVSNSNANFGRWDVLSDIVSPVGPDFRIPGQYTSDQDTNIDLGRQQDTHPALFEQYEQNGGFGPVYAIPTYPPHFTQRQVSDANPWQHNYGQGNGWGQWGGQFHTTIPFWSFNPWYIHPFCRHR